MNGYPDLPIDSGKFKFESGVTFREASFNANTTLGELFGDEPQAFIISVPAENAKTIVVRNTELGPPDIKGFPIDNINLISVAALSILAFRKNPPCRAVINGGDGSSGCP